MKVQCDLCKGLYKKSSLQIHIQGFCPVRRAMIAEENKAKAPVEDANETGSISIEYTGSGRARRKAAHSKYARQNTVFSTSRKSHCFSNSDCSSSYKNLIDANAGDNDSDGSFVCSNGSSSSDSMSNEGDTEGEESVINSDHSEFLDNDREERRARRRKAKKERKEKRKLADNLVKPDAISKLIWEICAMPWMFYTCSTFFQWYKDITMSYGYIERFSFRQRKDGLKNCMQ